MAISPAKVSTPTTGDLAVVPWRAIASRGIQRFHGDLLSYERRFELRSSGRLLSEPLMPFGPAQPQRQLFSSHVGWQGLGCFTRSSPHQGLIAHKHDFPSHAFLAEQLVCKSCLDKRKLPGN